MKTFEFRLTETARLAVLLILLVVFHQSAQGQAIPNLFPTFPAGTEGNTFSTVPFTGGSDTVRFQQLYDFHNLTIAGYAGPFLIRQIVFREDTGHPNGFFSRFPDFQVNLSTTAHPVDGLSSVFADNVGANDTTIIPRGSFQIGISSVGEFSAVINLSTPFYYDPSQGNLLLDIRNFGGGTTFWGVPPFTGPAYVDASSVLGDRVSSVSGSVDAASGLPSTLGLVTQFWITPIPEPSSWALLAIGLGVVIGRWKRLRACLKMGGAGHWPAPVGDSPTGRRESGSREKGVVVGLATSLPFRPASRRTAQASGLCYPNRFSDTL